MEERGLRSKVSAARASASGTKSHKAFVHDGYARARVTIETPTGSDAAPFFAAVRRSKKLHRSWVSPPATHAAFAHFVARAARADHRIFLVRVRETRELAGVVTLGDITFGISQSAFVGYYAFEPLARQGYMSEGVALVLDFAFLKLGLNRIEVNVQPDNPRSLRLARRLGFRREGYSPKYVKIAGRFRDHVRTAILGEEWKKRRAKGRRG
jgi:ribosomal-protein-alanine N-acetyltransferase